MTPRLDLVGMVVSDMAASLAFYRLLGLDVPDDADDQPHVEVALDGGLRLAWDTIDTVRSFDPGWSPASGGHRVALVFDCGSAEGVDRVHQQLIDAGHDSHLAPFDAVWGQRYAVVHDPDGNTVDLFSDQG